MDEEVVKVSVPVVDGGVDRETCWAVAVDVAAGHYRIDNVLFFADGVSIGDVVRCEPNAWHHLVAVEVVRRSPYSTLVFWRCDDDPFPTEAARDAALRDLLDAVGDDLGEDPPRSSGMGMLNVAVPPDRVDALLEVITTTAGGTRDDARRHAGEWVWAVVSSPDLPTGTQLPGAADLLTEEGPDLVAVDWPHPGDDLVAGWPVDLVEQLRDHASHDPRLRTALDDRRYLPCVALLARQNVNHELGAAAVGPQPFPLFPSPDADGLAAAREMWRNHRVDGRTRWAREDHADARIRGTLERLGLDPDADPYAPTT